MRFAVAFLFLALAFVLQFWLASAGIFINFIFAALIAFAMLFDIWDVVVFVLLAMLVINWQPAWSPELVLFAILPLAAWALHRYSAWEGWALNLATIAAGLLVLYLALAPGQFLVNGKLFLADLVVSCLFGAVIFAALNRRDGRYRI